MIDPCAAIDSIIESAICWNSDDADNPHTPPQDWQAIIPLLKAAPKLQAVLGDLLTDFNRLASEYPDLAELLNGDHGKAAYDALREARGI